MSLVGTMSVDLLDAVFRSFRSGRIFASRRSNDHLKLHFKNVMHKVKFFFTDSFNIYYPNVKDSTKIVSNNSKKAYTYSDFFCPM